jgi:hypothetical protein
MTGSVEMRSRYPQRVKEALDKDRPSVALNTLASLIREERYFARGPPVFEGSGFTGPGGNVMIEIPREVTESERREYAQHEESARRNIILIRTLIGDYEERSKTRVLPAHDTSPLMLNQRALWLKLQRK